MNKAGLIIVSLVSLLFFSCWDMPYEEESFQSVTSSLDKYEYEPALVNDIGRVYHYQKSNRNGRQAASVWVYIQSAQRTESFKIYPSWGKRTSTDLVIAEYDREGFYASSLRAYLIDIEGERTLNAEMLSENGETYQVRIGSDSYSLAAGHIPSYNYNFDWVDLSFNFRFLLDKEESFEAGMIVPNNRVKMIYAGKISFEYLGEGETGGRLCRQYAVRGNAFGNETGSLFMDSETGMIAEVSMPLQNTGSYQSFLFRLEEVFSLSPEEWDEFVWAKTREVCGEELE